MPGAERHSGARKWRACSHRAPKKQAKGDGRAAKGQHDHYGTCSWPMEKNMDQYGNVAAERNCARPEASGIRQQAAPGSVAASALAHGLLQLPGSKRGSVGAPRLMAACKYSGGEDGGGAEAKEAKLPLPRSSGGEVGVGVRAKEAKLRLQGCTPVFVVTCRVDLEPLIEQCTTFS
ncbi:hypothetical protein PR003_g28590 [Phytophthora rubi]|uniref:Uncharacterized protein n=1 Tax=Phytophthora rubi TaxID=129364 RepID=A0A6A3H9H5_9STRA|nr:hypothetical protein PR001_g28408 [Phytophthora rubi]KAE9278202.1 hypothetical protein PR003_g28590 [Phytophthora rubi]